MTHDSFVSIYIACRMDKLNIVVTDKPSSAGDSDCIAHRECLRNVHGGTYLVTGQDCRPRSMS
jgi:hypothetical protein